MFDFNFLNRCMIIQNPEKGFIEMKQFLIYIVRQNVVFCAYKLFWQPVWLLSSLISTVTFV